MKMQNKLFSKKKISNGFYTINLCKKPPFHYKFWGSIFISILGIYAIPQFSKLIRKISYFLHEGKSLAMIIDFTLIIALVIGLFKLWQWYFKRGRDRYPYPSCQKIRYFIKANDLYETDYNEIIKDGKIKKEKYISNSVTIACKENEKLIIIRAI